MPKRINFLFYQGLLPALLMGISLSTALGYVVFSPQLLAQVNSFQSIQLLAKAIEAQNLRGFQGKIKALALSPDGKTLLVGTGDNRINALDLRTKKVIYQKSHKVNDFASITISSDGKIFAIASEGTTVVSRLSDGKPLHTFRGHTGQISDVAISPDGSLLVSVSEIDRSIRVWDLLQSGELLKTITNQVGPSNNIAFTPDGTMFITGSIEQDRTFKFWNTTSLKLLKTSPKQPGYINGIAVTSNGQKLVAAVRNFVKSWDLKTGKELESIKGPSLEINAIAVSPDNHTVATANKEGTIMLFDLATRRLVKTLEGHQGWVLSVVFSPDGQYLYSGAEDKIVKMWKIN